jgi:hypothetical protein
MNETASALLALWNDVTPALDVQYNDWHANEHVPERLGVPGMLWGRRFQALPNTPGPRYLTLYGLQNLQVLESEAYRRLLSHPTPTTAQMRPHLHHISRWVCEVRTLRGVPSSAFLKLWTLDSSDEAIRMAAAANLATASMCLAEHLSAAEPLPWLKADQSQAVEGQWLFARETSDEAEAVDASFPRRARIYAALPIKTV